MAKPDWGGAGRPVPRPTYRFRSTGLLYPKRANRNRRKANCRPAVVQQRAMLEVTMSLQVSQNYSQFREGWDKQTELKVE